MTAGFLALASATVVIAQDSPLLRTRQAHQQPDHHRSTLGCEQNVDSGLHPPARAPARSAFIAVHRHCRPNSRAGSTAIRRRAALPDLVQSWSCPSDSSRVVGQPMTSGVIDQLIARIATVRPDGIARIAVDGPDAAGKSTFTATVARSLRRSTIAASIDGFHLPPEIRRRRGSLSPAGYYEDSFDYGAIRTCLLDPLSPGGNRRYRLAAYDYRTSTAQDVPVEEAIETAVLLVDGVFLLRPELRDYWDLSIYLHISPAETLRRAQIRDLELFGESVTERYTQRYLPGQALYRAAADPLANADVVVDNSDPQRPRILGDRRSESPVRSSPTRRSAEPS